VQPVDGPRPFLDNGLPVPGEIAQLPDRHRWHELLLVNAHHVKAVPGRKTDVKDCQWIAQLLEHGFP
jgi:hypothetical protein